MPDLNWEHKDKVRGKKVKSIVNEKTNLLEFSEYIHPKVIHKFRKKKKFLESENGERTKESKEKWRNKLIQGDCLKVLEWLQNDYKGKIDLIYIDPPFFSRKNQYYKVFIGAPKRSLKKIAYTDLWNKGLDSYLSFLYERLCLMRELLSDQGSIYLHLDHHASHYVKIMLDELFGSDSFLNEIIWHYPAASAQTKSFFVRSFDSILFYSKTEDYIFNNDPRIYMEYSDRVSNALQKDEKGYFYYRGGSHDGKKLSRKVYIERKGVFPRDVWTEIPYIRANTMEYQGFSTQKPERLLKRIILASSNKDSIIADFFCGSGTTIAAAEKLGRNWIGCDMNWHAINIVKKRLLSIQNSNDLIDWDKTYHKTSRPFAIWYLDKKNLEQAISSQFLKENITIKEIEELNHPKVAIKIKQDNSRVKVQLTNYLHFYERILKETHQEKVKSWKDYIDLFSIDFNYENGQFSPDWIEFRTPKKRELTFESGWYHPRDAKIITIKIRTLDIFGVETYSEREVKL